MKLVNFRLDVAPELNLITFLFTVTVVVKVTLWAAEKEYIHL